VEEIITISGIDCYEQDGTAYLKLEACARGLGFTKADRKRNSSGEDVEYIRLDWPRVERYLEDFGFGNKFPKDSFIPENIFYRLAMKAKNEAAERFQVFIADEVIPAIRKHGGYLTPKKIEDLLADPDLIIEMAQTLKAERQKLALAESELKVARPKAEYFDELVDRNTLTGIRESAKELKWKEREFTSFLLENKYVYRDQKGKLQPYAEFVSAGLFSLKECKSHKNSWSGTQMFFTPKGRETFRLLKPVPGK